VRITAQLIRAADDRHLWADSYETEMTDVLLLQSKMAADIAREVNAKLAPAQQAGLAKPRPIQPAAYESYLRGRFFWNTFTAKGIENAIKYFQQSIGLDPNYAPAYVGLADSYVMLNLIGFKPAKEVMPKAKEAVGKALALDDTLGEAHITLANIKFVYDWDWAGSDQEFRRGFALAPNCAVGHLWHSNYLTLLGHRGEGLEELRKAAELEPLSLIVSANLCRAYFWANRLDEAIVQCNKTIELDPRFWPPSEWLQMTYERKGMDRECADEKERLLRANGDQETAAKIRRIFVTSGLAGLKRWDALDTLDSEENGEFVSPMSLAEAYDDLGHREKAMQLVEKAYDDRDFGLLFTELDSHEPDRASMRSDPRYISILRKMNLPPGPLSRSRP
jgi:tetratricopeptide (TPR) repeat protein